MHRNAPCHCNSNTCHSIDIADRVYRWPCTLCLRSSGTSRRHHTQCIDRATVHSFDKDICAESPSYRYHPRFSIALWRQSCQGSSLIHSMNLQCSRHFINEPASIHSKRIRQFLMIVSVDAFTPPFNEPEICDANFRALQETFLRPAMLLRIRRIIAPKTSPVGLREAVAAPLQLRHGKGRWLLSHGEGQETRREPTRQG